MSSEQIFKQYFTFTKDEKRSLTLLLVLIILIAVIPRLFLSEQDVRPIEFGTLDAELEQFLKEPEGEKITSYDYFKEPPERREGSVSATIRPFPFDPNELSREGWLRMGFSARQVNSIFNYKASGGRFRVKEDVRKLYVITEETYALLEPYINIKPADEPKPFGAGAAASRPAILVDLNSADSVELLQLKGVGPAFASRIIKYRNLLGGFYDRTQLLEVYGMDTTRYRLFEGQLIVDPDAVRKFNINEATIDELRKHPYLNYYSAKALVDRRIQRGRITGIEELAKVPGLAREFERIKYYLKAE